MAFPQVADITQTTTQTDGTTFTVNLPATVNSGDLLLLLVSASAMSSAANGTATDWTQLRVQENNTNYASYLLAKIADGTEDGGTVVVDFAGQTGASFAAQVIRITANTWRNSGTLANDVEINSTNNNSAGIDPPALNPTNWDVEDTLWIAAGTFGQLDASLVTGAPTNYTNFLNTAAGAPQNCAVITARRELAAASEDPGTFTETIPAGNIGQWTIAIRPAVAGSSTWDIDMPVTVLADELLIVAATGEALTSSANGTISGWTQITEIGSNGAYYCAVLAKKAVGTEGGTQVTIDFGEPATSFAAQVFHITEWDNSGLVTAAVEGAAVNAADTADPPNLAPAWGNANNLWIAIATYAIAAAVTGAPANYSSLTTADGTNAYVASATRQLAAASENPGTFTEGATGQIGSITLAVKPVTAGGGGEGSENSWFSPLVRNSLRDS